RVAEKPSRVVSSRISIIDLRPPDDILLTAAESDRESGVHSQVLPQAVVLGQCLGQELESHTTVQFDVLGLVHYSHTTRHRPSRECGIAKSSCRSCPQTRDHVS